jgi:hypothetical protein
MNAQHNDAGLSSFNAAQWASPEGWEHHRKTIEKLYLDEDKTLKEVMSVMADQYGHKGTYVSFSPKHVSFDTQQPNRLNSMKMYKSRITKWGLDKNHKASDMAFILRKKTQRDAIKKPSAFCVRNKPVDMQDILRYVERKQAQDRGFRMASPEVLTPPHISCRTPTSALFPNAHDEDQQAQNRTRDDGEPQQAAFCHTNQQNFVLDSTMDGEQQWVHPHHQRSFLRGTRIGYSQHFDSQRQGVPSVISPPQVLLIPEQLFSTITSYFDGSFRKGAWILDKEGLFVSRNVLGHNSNHPIRFYNYCEIASGLIIQQSPVKGRQILSKAIALIPEMLRAEHPSTLENLLNAILCLKHLGFVGVAAMFLNYFYNMKGIVLSEDHPWFQMSRLMNLLDPDHHAAVLYQSWRCTTDAIGRALGRLSHASIRSQMYFLSTVCGTEDPLDVERHLRKLLADCEQARGPNDPCSLDILTMLGWHLLDQGRFMEAGAMGQDMFARAKDNGSDAMYVTSLHLYAVTQYYLGKPDLAERIRRDAMKKAADRLGRGSSSFLRITAIQEYWLRKWGRGEDADKLKQEMAELIGPDDLDV